MNSCIESHNYYKSQLRKHCNYALHQRQVYILHMQYASAIHRQVIHYISDEYKNGCNIVYSMCKCHK